MFADRKLKDFYLAIKYFCKSSDVLNTGKDLLKVRLDALNTIPFGFGEGDDPNVTGTNMTRTAFDEGSGGSVGIGKLYYTFALGLAG